jgi:hypothetical protein
MEGKEKFDDTYRLHSEVAISVGDLVLLFDSVRAVDMSSSKKLRFRWLGPYRVHAAHQDKGTYVLEDLDGTVFKHTTAGNNLKPFRVRTAYADADAGVGVGGQGTTTLLGGDEADDDEID